MPAPRRVTTELTWRERMVDNSLARQQISREVEEQAVCRQVDPELFFDPKTVDDAKAVCRRCPVKSACLFVALANNDRHAVLGGTTPRERAALRRRTARIKRQRGTLRAA